MKDYIQIGIEKGLISFNEDNSRIKYCYQGKERNYNNPEEKVQALAFLQLVIDYNYPERQIKQFEPVTMGSEVKELEGKYDEPEKNKKESKKSGHMS